MSDCAAALIVAPVQFVVGVEAIPAPVVIATQPFVLVVESQQAPAVLVSAGAQGPAGSVGSGEENAVYSERTDFVTEALIYRGEAAVGSPDSAAVWRIRRLTIGSDGDVTQVWADGNSNFDKVWDDRAGLVYS